MGISSSVPLNLGDVKFISNVAGNFGGGIYNVRTRTLVQRAIFNNNSASSGGAIYNAGSSNMILNDAALVENSASFGGAVYNIESNPSFTNVTLSQNSADYGGGIYNSSSDTILTNLTISGNSAIYSGGGIGNSNSSMPSIRNTIIWNNSSPEGSQIYNEDSNPEIFYSVVQGGCPLGSTCLSIITDDPLLGTLGDHGGYTQTITFPLLEGSSAIDTADDEVCMDHDQRVVSRPQGAGCDIGAFEVDTTHPAVVSSLRLDPNPTIAENINFTVTFSEPVTGVDLSDFSLSTTGVIDAAINEIDNNGMMEYVVTVFTGTGSGTIRLDVVDDDSILDLALNPLGSIGEGNGNYYEGETYDVNGPPSFTSVAITESTQDLLYSYNISATDPDDGDILSITSSIKPDWLTLIDNGDGTGYLSGTPTNADVGDHPVELVVTDSLDQTDTQYFIISVVNVNDAPLDITLSNTSIPENESIGTMVGTFNSIDPDGDTAFTYSLVSGSGDIDNDFFLIEGDQLQALEIFDFEAQSSYYIRIRSTDGGELSYEKEFTITVTDINEVPFFTSGPITSATQDILYIYNIVSSDSDEEDTLTITATTKPDWLTLTDNGDGTAVLSGSPGNSDVGSHAVDLLVTDFEGLSNTQSFDIAVMNANDAPYFTTSPKVEGTQDEMYSCFIYTDDPDLIYGDTLFITALTLPSWLELIDNGDGVAVLVGTPNLNDVGDHAVEMVVTDVDGLFDTQDFVIIVEAKPMNYIFLPLVINGSP